MPGILPEKLTGGAVTYRQADGTSLLPLPEIQNAYAPTPGFVASCELTALPTNCEARFEPKQLNAIVSELLALAECWDPNGPWNCTSLNNLCTAFSVWVGANHVTVDQVSIVGAGTPVDPFRVGVVDGGTY